MNSFVGYLVTPTFFGRSLSFLILSIILKNKKKNLYAGSFNCFSYTIQIGLNWYMNTGVRDLEVAFLRLILPDLMTCNKDLSNRPKYAVLKTRLRYDSSI